MDIVLIIIVVTAMMVFANAFYVAAEFAIMNVRHTRISQQAANGHRLAQKLERVITDAQSLDTCIAACQVGITLSSLILGYYAQATIATYLTNMLATIGSIGLLASHVLATILILLTLIVLQVAVGEMLSRSIASGFSETVALFVIVPLGWSVTFFRPAIAIFNWVAALILRILGVSPVLHHGHIMSPEEIDLLAKESARSGLIEAGERQLLHNVFRASALTAAEVMVPRTRLVAARYDTPIPHLLELATTSGHTRIPLYDDTIDTIVGSVHLKDLFRLHVEYCATIHASVIRKVSYAPEWKPALAVWRQLQQENSYIAIVQDDFGGTAGMITIADLLEEIFGELQDEFDNEPSLIARSPDGFVRLHGEVIIANVNDWFNLHLPDEEVNTIGGLVMATLERLPEVGDQIAIGGATLRVEAVNGPTVIEICLKPESEHLPYGSSPSKEEK